jgi:hypothetical protein
MLEHAPVGQQVHSEPFHVADGHVVDPVRRVAGSECGGAAVRKPF